jgi:hypothetical protein
MAAKTSAHKKAPARRDILERFHLLPGVRRDEDPEPLTGVECRQCPTAQRRIRILALLFGTKSLDAGVSATLA